jgi:hypothetical protein
VSSSSSIVSDAENTFILNFRFKTAKERDDAHHAYLNKITTKKLFNWTPSYSESYPHSSKIKRLNIYHDDGSGSQTLIDIEEFKKLILN